MKNEADVIRVTRWIDGELKDSEIRDLLEGDPDLKEEGQAMRDIGDWVRKELAMEGDVPLPDLFNRQILRRIEEERQKSLANRARGFFSWMTASEWGLPVAASAALLFLLAAGLRLPGNGDFQSRVVHTFTPNPAHAAKTQEIGGAGVTVIALQGLAPLPSTAPVMGYFPAGSGRWNPEGGMMAATTYYGEDEKPLLLLTMNAAGEPRLRSLR